MVDMNKANIVKYLRVHAIYLDAPVYIVAESIQGYEQLVRPKYKRKKLKIYSLLLHFLTLILYLGRIGEQG